MAQPRRDSGAGPKAGQDHRRSRGPAGAGAAPCRSAFLQA